MRQILFLISFLLLAGCPAFCEDEAGEWTDVELSTQTKEKVEEFERSANFGDAGAMYKLALSYYEGNGVEKDVKVASEWFHKAAAKGNVHAMVRLGRMYSIGLTVEKDLSKAVSMYTLAGDIYKAVAQFEKALKYYKTAQGLTAKKSPLQVRIDMVDLQVRRKKNMSDLHRAIGLYDGSSGRVDYGEAKKIFFFPKISL